MESLLSIAGSIASVGAAIWAYVEAGNAAKSASKAESVRIDMIGRRELAEVSKVHVKTDTILTVVSKIGPSCSTKKLTGFDSAGIAKEVEEYSRYLNEKSSHFSDFFENKAKKLCDDLKKDIEELSEADDPEIVKTIGSRIYYKINSFMPFVKNLADEKQEDSVAGK